MTDWQGGFYSAEDADSVPHERLGHLGAHASEGAFYLWGADEVVRLCGDDAELVCRAYGIEAAGNAPADPQGEFVGKNILFLPRTLDELAVGTSDSTDEIRSKLERARMTLFAARLERPRPLLDDKVLTSWNGLMIAAFARTSRVMGGRAGDARSAMPYLQAARAAAAFLGDHAWRPETGILMRRYRQGHAEIDGYAEDYACLVFGLLELFQADPDPKWLEWAETLQRRQDELFWDDEAGGWFSTDGSDPHVLVRMKDTYDGAEPAATSIAALNLLTLSGLLDNGMWPNRLDAALRAFAPHLESMGRAVPMMAAALSTYHAGPAQFVVVGADGGPLERALLKTYLPHATTLILSGAQQAALGSTLPLVAAMPPVNGGATVYLCRHFVCQSPITSTDELDRATTAPRNEVR
jgi:uncharacterized protein YyaL (SSP411 family)